MEKNFSNYVSMLATKSILYEVSTTPKPGLVDRFNSGAHSDMDFFTFINSSAAISYGFYEIAEVSKNFDGKNPIDLFNKIRPIGIKMESDMLNSTGGINTHKGIIFSLGLVCSAASTLNSNSKLETIRAENIAEYVSKMTNGLTKELEYKKKSSLTNGEKIFKSYGIKGIRGEVESGFSTVFKTSLDELRKSYYTFSNKNNLFIQMLFRLMAECEDSNIISRHNPETLYEVQEMARKFLFSGGMYKPSGISKVKELDTLFIKRNISPGGSADLLAVSIFLGLLEKLIK